MKKYAVCILAALLVAGLLGANLLTWTGSYPEVPDSGPDPHHPDRYQTVWGAWDPEKLTPVTGEPEDPGYGIRLLSQDGPEIRGEIYNEGIEKAAYPDLPWLQVQLEGVWYWVPRAMSVDQGLSAKLDPGRTEAVTMNKAMLDTFYNWSRLPKGAYRLLWHGRYFDLSAVQTEPEPLPDQPHSGYDPYHPVRYLTDGGTWDKSKLRGASTRGYDVDCTARVLSRTDQKLEVELSNSSDKPQGYDHRYSFEVLLEGVWYVVPTRAVSDDTGVEQSVAPGEVKVMTFDLRGLEGWNWSRLPAGQYRLRWLGEEFLLER